MRSNLVAALLLAFLVGVVALVLISLLAGPCHIPVIGINGEVVGSAAFRNCPDMTAIYVEVGGE